MTVISKNLENLIEVERLWLATEQGRKVVFSSISVFGLLVFGLWGSASHALLLIWFVLFLIVQLVVWFVLHFFYLHKDLLAGNVRKFKNIVLAAALLSGLLRGLCVIWFMTPSQPENVLILYVPLLCVALVAMLTWYCYLPALIAMLFPVTIPMIVLLLLHGGNIYIAISLIILLLSIYSITCSISLANGLNYTLRLNFENAALRKEAERVNVAKTRFLAAASHDLRQPIHALGLFFGQLADQVHSPETEPIINQVEDSIDAINSMLNALLDVSRLDAGIVKPVIESCRLQELLCRLDTEFQPVAKENHNQLKIRLSSAIVKTDLGMLERILRNLIGNALRYTQNGRVLVATRLRGKNVEIQVLDTGSGIPENQLEDVFIEFHQLHNPARDRRQGLGLGLAIVKRLAALLQHDIKVFSKVGRGSCFAITLPLAASVQDTTFKQQRELVLQLNTPFFGKHVLVVDDDIAILEGMKGLLIRWGCQVITVSSPDVAFEKAINRTDKLDLVIVDYRLPENVSGIDVARDLQNRLKYPVPVLIITGDTGPERLQEAEVSGFPLLHKPVKPAVLRSALQYIFNTRFETKCD